MFSFYLFIDSSSCILKKTKKRKKARAPAHRDHKENHSLSAKRLTRFRRRIILSKFYASTLATYFSLHIIIYVFILTTWSCLVHLLSTKTRDHGNLWRLECHVYGPKKEKKNVMFEIDYFYNSIHFIFKEKF